MKDKGESISLFLLQKIGAGWVKTSELQIMNNYLELGVGGADARDLYGDGCLNEDG